MDSETIISGRVVEGSHKASSFTCLPWVQDQCRTKLGFEPFAGTLNLEIRQKNFDILDSLEKELMHELTAPDNKNCSARVYPEEFLKHVHPFPCTRSILKTLHAAKIKIAIATSTNKKFINDKMKILDQTGVSHLIEFVICAEDVKRKKPYPDSLLLCRKRLGILSEKCVYIGDMGTDIDAGKAAGMKTIAVLTGFETRKELETKHPDAILTSIADLPDVLDIQRTAKNC